ncbi:MAG: tRNA pseudouridine(55) synthase TruB [Candidatus Peregrinibacteria bacterium]
MKGFYLIDKKKGVTSFDVVREIRRKTGEKRVGHAGTLDPLATGLLIVAVGRENTRELGKFLKSDKEYVVSAKFGSVSDTYDSEGKVEECDVLKKCSRKEVEELIEREFLGEIDQVPPKYSALKVGGRKACDVMRKGGDVELTSRKVKVYKFDVIEFKWPVVTFKVACGSGTYIRSLVHDLGQKLGCGAYVAELRRTKVGDYSVEDAGKIF